MRAYAVELTATAQSAIAAQARHIAVEEDAPLDAQRWLEKVWDAVDSLERWPFRAARAEEAAYVRYEVRQLIIDSHLLLFTVSDKQRKVWVSGLRHGHRLPRPQDLPDEAPGPDSPRESD